MKKKAVLFGIGIVLGLTACGKQEAPAAPADQTAETIAEVSEASEVAAESEESAAADIQYLDDAVVTADTIKLSIPEEFAGKVYATVNGEEIGIYDKELVDAGWPGFAFSFTTDKNKELVAGGMYKKVGEIVTADGEWIDVCQGFPSEVQWDYNEANMPESYEKLSDSADAFTAAIEALDGGSYINGGGTKGEDLYGYNVQRYIDAINEGWDAGKFEEEGMSPEFYAIAANEGDKAFDKIGFAYKDVTGDGVDELLVGAIPQEATEDPTPVYDIYTVVDRAPALVVSGTARNFYYGNMYSGIVNVASGGAGDPEFYSYSVTPGTTELFLQFGLKNDIYTDEKNPWFVCYDADQWEPMTEEDYNSRLGMLMEQCLKLDYTPLSELVPIDYSKVDLSQYGTFTKMLADFKKGMGFANEPIGDTDVFFASSGTFNGENGTKNAIDSSLFIYDSNGSIVYLGQIASSGTATPLAIADGCVYTAGHHWVTKSTVKEGKLVTVEEARENFDADGNSTFTYTSEKDGEQKVEDDTQLTRLFEEMANAKPIEFSVEKP